MANKDSSPFRERRSEPGGLKHGGSAPPDLPSLKLEPAFDLSRLTDFAGPQMDVAGVAGKVKPQGGGDLRVDFDLSKLDEGVHKLQKQRLSQKIQALIDKAQKLIAKQQFRPAISPLDEALKLDRTSAPVLFLKAFCFFSLEEYQPALDILHKAREHADDPDTVVLILILEAACLQSTAKRVEAQVMKLIDKKQLDRALGLVEGELRRQPQNPALLYLRCGLLMMMKKLSQSKQAALEAMAAVGEENAELFQDLLAQIAVQENQRYLEAARLALRKGDPAGALKELQACRIVLAGNEQYEAIRSYAEERSRRGFFSSMFSRDKAKPLSGEARERLLQWLLSEDLNAGASALNKSHYDAAIRAFNAAAKIDGRCRILCFLHGLAIVKDLEQRFENKAETLDFDRCISSLRQASRLVDTASAEPMIEEESKALGAKIAEYLSQLEEVGRERARREEESRAVNGCIQAFNTMMEYFQKHPIRNWDDLQLALSMLKALDSMITTARASQSRGSEGWKALDQLEAAIAEVRKQLAS